MPKKSTKPVTGVFDCRFYQIRQGKNVLYQAGNSAFDSQVYVPADEGVGIDQMRNFCKSSISMFAEKLGVEEGEAKKRKVYALFVDEDGYQKTLNVDPPKGTPDFTWL